MVKTGSPYLESGESLILTTDRVSVNAVQYDVLLTNHYLILVDARYTQFQPEKIPLTTIQSVKGGKTASGELVITLFFTETASSSGSESMVLLFSQQPFEQRKRERDEWLKNLMGLIVSIRQEASYDGVTTAGPEIGIRPSKRRQISPEIPPPFTKVIESGPAQIELIIIPDEPESPVLSEEYQEIPEGSFPGVKTETEVTPALCAIEETPVTSEDLTESPDTVLPPAPSGAETLPASQEMPESPATQSLSETRRIVESALIPKEEAVSQKTAPLVVAFEEIHGEGEAESGSQKTAPASLMAAVKSLSSPSGTSGVGNTLFTPYPAREEPPVAIPEDMVLSDTSSSQTESIPSQKTSVKGEKPDASQDESLSPDLLPPQEPVTAGSMAVAGQNIFLTETATPEAGNGDRSVQPPATEETPPAPGPLPPSSGPDSRRMVFVAIAAIILVILGIAGVFVFYQQNPEGLGVEPAPLPTPAIQQTPQPTPVFVPPTGVWVRVGYPRSYYGWVGNAGSVRGVSGSGDQIYKIPEIEGIVQVQLYKTDNSGDTLTVEIYRDGKIIGLRNVSTPMGSVELLIDAKTGNPPAMTPVVTPSVNETGSNVGRIMYF